MASTFYKIHEQIFPATYSFRDETVGSAPSDWTVSDGAGCATTIIASEDGHRMVLKCYDNGAGAISDYFDFSSSQTSGTIEFWAKHSVTNLETYFYISSDAGLNIGVGFRNNAQIAYLTNPWVENDLCAYAADTWYHFRIDFDCTTDTFDIYIDGTSQGSGLAFRSNATTLSRFYINTHAASSGYTTYVDAVGCSWDTSYAIGDNAQWRSLKDDADTTSDFESEDWLESGTSIGFIDSATVYDGGVIIDLGFDEHKKILRLQDDATAGEDPTCYHSETAATAGERELWIKTSDVTQDWFLIWYDSSVPDDIIRLRINASNLYYRDNADVYQTIQAVANSTWYHLRLTFRADNTFDLYVDNALQVSNVSTNNNQSSGIDRFYLLAEGDSTAYLYIDAYGDITNDASYYIADNRTYAYQGDTKEDVTAQIWASPFTKDEYGWCIVNIEAFDTSLTFDANSFLQLYDTDGYLRFEGYYVSYNASSQRYTFHDMNKTFLMEATDYQASAAEDANATFLAICTNLDQSDGRCIYYTEDDPAGNMTPQYRGTKPFHIVAAELAGNISKILVIKPNGVCFMDDDATPAQGAYTITYATGEIMNLPYQQAIDSQINYVRIEGAIDPSTGAPFYGVSQDATAQGGAAGIVRYYRRFLDLRSNTDCATKAASIRSNLNPSNIIVALKDVYATPGEIINFSYSPLSITAANYYVQTISYNLNNGINTVVLCDGLFTANDAAINQFPLMADNQADIGATLRETDLITVDLALIPVLGSTWGDHGVFIEGGANEHVSSYLYLPSTVDTTRQMVLHFIFRNTDAGGAVTVDGILNLYKLEVDGSYDAVFVSQNVSFDAVFTEDSGYYYKSHEPTMTSIAAEKLYQISWKNDDAGDDVYCCSIQATYYVLRSV